MIYSLTGCHSRSHQNEQVSSAAVVLREIRGQGVPSSVRHESPRWDSIRIMIRATTNQDVRCARPHCGMSMYNVRDRLGFRIIHPYSLSPYSHCIDEGRVFRRDLSFAGWWITRQEFIERYQ